MDDDFEVARLVMRVRRMADLSQRDLAARLGMSPSTVARIETGGCSVSVGLLSRILGFAGLRLAAVGADGVAVSPSPSTRCATTVAGASRRTSTSTHRRRCRCCAG